MGNTCKPMAVSFQCMTKSTTNKKRNINWDTWFLWLAITFYQDVCLILRPKKEGKNHIYWFLPWAQIPQKLSEKLSSVPNKSPNKTEIHSSHILSCFFFPHSITHSPLPKNNHYLYFDILPSRKFLISYCFNNWYFVYNCISWLFAWYYN